MISLHSCDNSLEIATNVWHSCCTSFSGGLFVAALIEDGEQSEVWMKQRAPAIPLVVMTIGHSTRLIDAFIQLLRAHGVQRLVDVRTVPRSRHNPQFNRDQLSPSLHSARIHYSYMPGLGGFRHAQHDSVNMGWHNASFRGYADYMQTPEFRKCLGALIELAQQERIAVMCAEAVPWRCHRSLIADALLVRGIEVREITSRTGTRLHSLTPFAQVHGTQVIYPAEQPT
jgi:uncharacterized protein (DUF488 family)